MKTVLSSVLLAVLALLCATPKCHAQDGDCYGDDCYFEDDEYGYGDFEIYYAQSLDYYPSEQEVVGQSEIWTPYDDYGWGFYMGVSSIIWAPDSTELANGWQQDDLDAYLEVESWTPEDGLYTLYSDYFYCWDDWNWTEIDEWPSYVAVSLPVVTSSNIDQTPMWLAGSSGNSVDIYGTNLAGVIPILTGWCTGGVSISNLSSSDGEISFSASFSPGITAACIIGVLIGTWEGSIDVEPPPLLTCPSSVARGGFVTCTATPATLTPSNWTFTDGSNQVTRTTNTGNLTWPGSMATSGTVSVTLTDAYNNSTTVNASVTVTNRTGFAFTAVSPSKQSNPYNMGNCDISVPTEPAANNDVGYSCLGQYYYQTPHLIAGNGPNNGYRYVYAASNSSGNTATTFNYIIAGYLDDSGSEFAQKQCGNYNPSTGVGYISYTQLKSNTYEHESGNTTGHYAQYTSAQNDPANNMGVALESVVGPPSESESQFNQQASQVAATKGGTIASATGVEACNHDVEYDTACVFKGYINWPAYASCQ